MGLKILTDSSCDLPLSYMEENAHILQFLGMPIQIEDEEFIDDLGKTLTHEFFYNKLSQGAFPRTSQINLLDYLERYKTSYEKGDTLICLGLSSGLSGTMNNAVLAKKMFLEEHQDAQIYIVDTLAASGGLGSMVAHVVDLVKAGKTVQEILEWLEVNTLKFNHWFAIDDLEHLKNGGRIPSAIALVGTALKVKPILTIAHDGKIKSYASVRGRHKSIKYLYEKFNEHIGDEADKQVFICHAHCIEDALKLQKLILESHNPKAVHITELSATIGAHVGLGMLAVAFLGKDIRDDK